MALLCNGTTDPSILHIFRYALIYVNTPVHICHHICFLVNAICQGLRLSYVGRNVFFDVSTCDMYTYGYAAALENQALYSS